MNPDIEAPLSDGRYRLIDVLGEGGMAVVYRAYDERLQVYRAVKVLSSVYGASSTLQERFLKEARTMARIQHPNIVSVHDMGSDGGRSFMVMEVVEGGSLTDWLTRHGPMPARLAIEALLPILAALEAAHEAGVVHRDIKPQNILITGTGKPKITDFGIARVTDEDKPLTRTGSVMGTWGYMAPEQRMNAKQVDSRADLYGVGATLFTLLLNELPVDLFVNEIDGAVLERVDPLVRPILRRATRYRPEDRYQSAAEMAGAFAEVLALLPPTTEETPPLAGPVHVREVPPPVVVDSRETMVPDSSERAPNATFVPEEPNSFSTTEGDLAVASLSGDQEDSLPGVELRRPILPYLAGGGAVVLLLLLWVLWPGEPSAPPAPPPAAKAAIEPPEAEPSQAVPSEVAPPEAAPPVEPPVEVAPPVESPAVSAPPPKTKAKAVEPTVEAPKITEPPEAPPWGASGGPATPTVRPAMVSVRGDASSVQLQSANGARFSPGEVPPGTYTVLATFADDGPKPAGKLILGDGDRVTLSCNANFAACKAERNP